MCVLGRCDENILDRERMESLLLAGLGKARIVFPNKKATHEEFPVLFGVFLLSMGINMLKRIKFNHCMKTLRRSSQFEKKP